MIGDWIEMTSTTGGASTLTLSAVTGSPGYTDLFGTSGTRWVQYSVDEYTDSTRTVLSKGEVGIGSLVLSTSVLTRTKILATWNGTTYATAAPSAVSFGSTAANIRVVCAPLAEAPSFAMAWMQGSVGDAIGVTSAHHYVLTATYTGAANQECYVPFLWAGTADLVQGSIVATSGVASTAVKAAMYELDATGLPGRKLFDIASGTPLSTTASGNVSATIAAYLPPGWYYAGLLFQGASILRGATQVWPGPAGSSSGTTAWCLTGTGSYATGLPSTRSITPVQNTASAPCLFLKARN